MYNARKDAQRAKRRARRLDALTPAQLTVIYTRIRSRLSSDHTYAFGWHWTELQRRNPATAKILRAVIAAYNRQTMPVQDRAQIMKTRNQQCMDILTIAALTFAACFGVYALTIAWAFGFLEQERDRIMERELKTEQTPPSELMSSEPDETEQSEIDKFMDDLDDYRENLKG